MTERYDSHAATHYAAFRPSLHGPLLIRMIRPGESFRVGLDVGCGTGYSSVALAQYCDQVFGVDPSPSMLAEGQRHPKITYIRGSGDSLDHLPVQTFDIVTFAGSLFYAKTERLRHQLIRVCSSGASILVYDFDVLLDAAMKELGVTSPVITSGYDHRVNLSGWAEFVVETSGTERLRLELTEREMAHILLADSNRYDALVEHFSCEDPFEALVNHVKRSPRMTHLDADIFFTRYRVVRGEQRS
jgi:ubiquinone/menaquinone biosynthesis C-methylase UbiE